MKHEIRKPHVGKRRRNREKKGPFPDFYSLEPCAPCFRHRAVRHRRVCVPFASIEHSGSAGAARRIVGCSGGIHSVFRFTRSCFALPVSDRFSNSGRIFNPFGIFSSCGICNARTRRNTGDGRIHFPGASRIAVPCPDPCPDPNFGSVKISCCLHAHRIGHTCSNASPHENHHSGKTAIRHTGSVHGDGGFRTRHNRTGSDSFLKHNTAR